MIGAHVRGDDPIAEADARKADLVQTFLSDPQSWKAPPPHPRADDIRASQMPLYVHAPYLINVGSPNNRIRIPSRKIIADTVKAAEDLKAAAVIVHGGHIGDDEDESVGYERWRKALQTLETDIPIYIENTAGGGNAIARSIDKYGPLWEEIGDMGVGACLDTCHAWSAGEDLESVVDRLIAATGAVDLVHCNDSRDPAGSGRDRHESLGKGQIPQDLLLGVVKAADAPIVVETPGDADAQGADIAWLRDRL
ncbi:MAG: deoxyribonuclease IV [Acidimicrobiia bacterium]|nr:deoxyribonuclease IV [Acidimicrobiia bacterium]